ncbi:hypothetical protein, partial [Hymenobacter coccineus]|uniref:hypothetical protein n=1 Tax=Hymenobacter coccineus TaxID=1908235 RepID=UPI001955AC7C
MTTPDLPLLPPGARRIPFAAASAPQAAQALAYATAHLAALFPRLDWPAWRDAFGDVQPDLVVQGPAAWLEGPALVRLVQRLATSADHPGSGPPG